MVDLKDDAFDDAWPCDALCSRLDARRPREPRPNPEKSDFPRPLPVVPRLL
jgi:hypothetical protein